MVGWQVAQMKDQFAALFDECCEGCSRIYVVESRHLEEMVQNFARVSRGIIGEGDDCVCIHLRPEVISSMFG